MVLSPYETDARESYHTVDCQFCQLVSSVQPELQNNVTNGEMKDIGDQSIQSRDECPTRIAATHVDSTPNRQRHLLVPTNQIASGRGLETSVANALHFEVTDVVLCAVSMTAVSSSLYGKDKMQTQSSPNTDQTQKSII